MSPVRKHTLQKRSACMIPNARKGCVGWGSSACCTACCTQYYMDRAPRHWGYACGCHPRDTRVVVVQPYDPPPPPPSSSTVVITSGAPVTPAPPPPSTVVVTPAAPVAPAPAPPSTVLVTPGAAVAPAPPPPTPPSSTVVVNPGTPVAQGASPPAPVVQGAPPPAPVAQGAAPSPVTVIHADTRTAGINRLNTAVRAVLKQPCLTSGRTGTVRPKREPTGRTDLSDRSWLVLCDRSQELIGQACTTCRQVLWSDSACPTTGQTVPVRPPVGQCLSNHRSNSACPTTGQTVPVRPPVEQCLSNHRSNSACPTTGQTVPVRPPVKHGCLSTA
ncbi:hypothetical protein PCANC_14792 [Puccinia coronata f. sp. avenae]|uniref:Uncharacterized protein n=1 Tax=Puccinia coronata f. sp. avenae TaxID=200324 RepID=A0A2N5SNV8_9BASI|nr:hypothetical protein PCANC_14792 [Puccinia coronata f. sp. avenae]